MPRDKEGTQRKVFMLPDELVDRITKYQKDAGLPSEVEAVRRLLDDALKFRDDWWSLAARFRGKLADTRVLADAARDILVGHPLVANMTFNRNSLEYSMTTGELIQVQATGEMSARDSSGHTFFNAEGFRLDEAGKVTNSDLPF